MHVSFSYIRINSFAAMLIHAYTYTHVCTHMHIIMYIHTCIYTYHLLVAISLLYVGMDDYDQSSNESSGSGEIIKPLM